MCDVWARFEILVIAIYRWSVRKRESSKFPLVCLLRKSICSTAPQHSNNRTDENVTVGTAVHRYGSYGTVAATSHSRRLLPKKGESQRRYRYDNVNALPAKLGYDRGTKYEEGYLYLIHI